MLPAGPTVTTGKLRRALFGGAISKPFHQVVDIYRDRQALDNIALDIARDRQALHIALDIIIWERPI